MASFKTVALKEICHLITDGVHQKPDYKASGIPFVSIKDFSNGKFSLENTKFISESDHIQFNKRCNPQFNDILYSKVGSYGIACLVETHQPFSLYVSVCLIKPKRDIIDSKFLLHLLNSPIIKRQADKCVKGIGVPDLHLIEIKNFQIPLPPLPEQQRIAAILDKADALREKRRRTIAKLDELLESSFSQLYENKSLLNTVKLEDVAEKSRGSFVNGPFGSDLLTSELTKSGVPVIYIRDIRDGEYNRVSESFVSKGKAEKLSVCSVFPGDVLIAKVGDPPGTAALYPQTEPPGIVTQDVIRIRINSQIVTPEFLVSYFNSPIGRWNISKIVIEATRARFSLTELKQLCLEVPLIQQQRKFSIIAQKISVLKLKQKQALYRLEQLFLSLQQRAFSGELFTQQANEELNAATNEEKTGQMSLFDLMG